MFKRNQFVLPSIVLVVILLLVGNFVVEQIQSASSFISRAFENDSEKMYRKIFLISDEEIRELVSEGMDLKSDDWLKFDSKNELPSIQENFQKGHKKRLPTVVLNTPQNKIPTTVYRNKQSLHRPYLADYHSSFGDRPPYEVHFPILKGKWLSFSIDISLSEEEASPNLTVSLKQEDREVYSEKSTRITQKKYLFYDEEKKLFSDDRYIRFDADPKIVDYSKPAELYVSWDDTSDYAVYELDFKKFIK